MQDMIIKDDLCSPLHNTQPALGASISQHEEHLLAVQSRINEKTRTACPVSNQSFMAEPELLLIPEGPGSHDALLLSHSPALWDGCSGWSR